MKMKQFIDSLQDFMVFVRCFTYNHSAYIKDALNSFTMQNTNFPFVIVVVDDASTDGEQEVIKEYVSKNFSTLYNTENKDAYITVDRHKTNENCYLVVYYLKENHYSIGRFKFTYTQPWRDKSKYEALCEGDDYWIDPLKLQKQVDFLESHPDYVLSYSDKIVINKVGKRVFVNRLPCKSGDLFEYLIFKGNPISTASTCFRITSYLQVLKIINEIGLKINIIGDYPLWIIMSKLGKFKYDETPMITYRLLPNSASHSSDPQYIVKFCKEELMIRMKLYKKFTGKNAYEKFEKIYYRILIRKMLQYDRELFLKFYMEGIKKYPILLMSPKLSFFFIYKFFK